MADAKIKPHKSKRNTEYTLKLDTQGEMDVVPRGCDRTGHPDSKRSRTLPPSKPPRIGTVFEAGFTASRRHGDTGYTVGIVIGPQLEADSK